MFHEQEGYYAGQNTEPRRNDRFRRGISRCRKYTRLPGIIAVKSPHTPNEMDRLWNRDGKMLCGLYARENRVGFMVIFGKNERLKFETDRENYSKEIQETYDAAKTYHDGKWVMFEPVDASLFDDFIKLLKIKRRPNRK